jgi:hypothetical protein
MKKLGSTPGRGNIMYIMSIQPTIQWVKVAVSPRVNLQWGVKVVASI